MRDPARIREFCNELADLWERHCPDWRFGQLVENVCQTNDISDLFYVEDDVVMECLRKAVAQKDSL